MIEIADEWLNKVSHLTVNETAARQRLLQDDGEIIVPPTKRQRTALRDAPLSQFIASC
jgi:hypothetical protein